MMRISPTLMRCCVLTLLAVLTCGLGLNAQASFDQTLPPGLKNTPSTSSTSFPFNSSNDNTWQWHYDAGLFVHNGPMMINRIYVRLQNATAAIGPFSYNDLSITLAEANSLANSASTTFDANYLRAEVVRTGAYTNQFDTTGNGTVAGWIPIDFQRSFRYDPSTGNGLIIELRSCGVNTSFGASIAYEFNPSAARRGDTTSCTATSAVTSNSSGAPLVKIDYTPILTQTLPAGFDSVSANSSTGFPFNSNSDSLWQWHYDAGEFASSGPINIRELSVRASSTLSAVAAFDYPSFEVTLIEASTDYQVGNHDPIFANNVLRSKVVRAGGYSAPATPGSGGTTATWISLQLEDSFDYDPSSGNDLIIQLRTCGLPTQNFGTSIDTVIGPAGTIGGNRYGHTSDCMATTANFMNNDAVPVVLLGYVPKVVTSFPYRENFDLYGASNAASWMPPAWETAVWQTRASTTSVGTAAFDHSTMRQGVGFYATLDDSLYNSSVGDTLSSPWLDVSGLTNPIVSFWLYSHSIQDPALLDENVLIVSLESTTGSGTSVLPTLTTQGHSNWVRYAVDLTPYLSLGVVRMNFTATTDSANSFYHDFSIDSFEVGSAPASEGGQAARIVGRLDINGAHNNSGFHVDNLASGPFYTSAQAGGALNISIDGAGANQPGALWIGPLNIAVATFGALGQIDTGTPDVTGDGIPENILLFGSGLNPVPSFNDLFYFTNAVGQINMSWQLYPFMPLGTIGTFQAATADGLGGIFMTNAVVLEIAP